MTATKMTAAAHMTPTTEMTTSGMASMRSGDCHRRTHQR
jgi:hypothetical protein